MLKKMQVQFALLFILLPINLESVYYTVLQNDSGETKLIYGDKHLSFSPQEKDDLSRIHDENTKVLVKFLEKPTDNNRDLIALCEFNPNSKDLENYPPHAKKLIEKINARNNDNISCVNIEIRNNPISKRLGSLASLLSISKKDTTIDEHNKPIIIKTAQKIIFDSELELNIIFEHMKKEEALIEAIEKKYPKLSEVCVKAKKSLEIIKKELESEEATTLEDKILDQEKSIDKISDETSLLLNKIKYLYYDFFNVHFIEKLLTIKHCFAFVGYAHAIVARDQLIKNFNFKEIGALNCSNLTTDLEILNKIEIDNIFVTYDSNFAPSLKKALDTYLGQTITLESSTRNCSYCKSKESETAQLLRCSKCKSALYCNSSCQKEDWVMHKIICGDLTNWKK